MTSLWRLLGAVLATTAMTMGAVSPSPAQARDDSVGILADRAPEAALEADIEPDRLVVTVDHVVDAAERRDLASEVGGVADVRVTDRTFVVQVGEGEGAAALKSISSDDSVVSVRPETQYSISRVPNDPCFASCTLSGGGSPVTASQWGLQTVDAAGAWSVSIGDNSVAVAVLDTGVDGGHLELANRVVIGTNFVGTSGHDGNGHGTHVTGVIAAESDNGRTIAGMGWNTRVLSVKVLENDGTGGVGGIAAGVRYAADQGVRVINMSLSGQHDPILEAAIAYAQNRGVLIIGAVGNDGSSTVEYPAGYSNVLSVAATRTDDALAGFSNRGAWVDIAAPGEGILSTWPGNAYQLASGTSMAAPFVSATAALLFASQPSATAATVSQRLVTTADPIAGGGIGGGRLDAGAALHRSSEGYWLSASSGTVYAYGGYASLGSVGGLNRPIVDIAASKTANGYWLTATDGGIFTFGDAAFHGSTGAIALNSPIVGMAPTQSGNGYWLVASDGGIFSFGDAAFHGSTGAIRLNQPIVGMATTPSGNGYWLVASDGGIFSFGDAAFQGSTGAIKLNQPIVGMAQSGNGYWLVASDGGIFAFGNAAYLGSTGDIRLNSPIVGMSQSEAGNGYRLVAADGGLFTFGNAPFYGSAGGTALDGAIVAMA